MSHLDVSPITGPETSPFQQSRNGEQLDRNLPPLPTSAEPALSHSMQPRTNILEKHPSVPLWPDEPQTLHRGGWLAVLGCMGDVVVIMTSTMFFVYGALVIYFDGVPMADVPHLSILQDASRYGPTIFPILFAAIVGQAMHAIAHWRLENGERMKVLDQLLGSTGLFSTIITQLKFNNMGLVGLALICLWILSPLGGQASLRVLDYSARLESRPRAVYAMDWNSTFLPGDSTVYRVGEATESSYIATTIFGAALSSSMESKNAPMDLWGNIKIPMIERLTNSVQFSDGWREVPRANVTYSSLVGVPWSGVSAETNSTFNMEHAYWTLDCPVREEGFRIPGVDSGKLSNNYTGSKTTSWGMTTLFANRIYETDTNLTSRAIYYAGMDGESDKQFKSTNATCYMNTSYVELEISCIRQNCSATRIRPSTKPHPPSVFCLGMEWQVGSYLSSFTLSVGYNMQLPTAIQRYFRQPADPFSNKGGDLALHNLSNTEFSTPLAQLMNSYWLAGIGVSRTTSGVSTPISDTQLPPRNASRGGTYFQAINATESVTIPVIKCAKPWLAVLFIATGAMFLAGALGLVLEFTRKAPDFALNISSLTRDNPYIQIPPGGSTLDSIDRSRLLKDVRIRLGDIKPDDLVGYVAIASCDRDGKVLKLNKLDRKRTFS